MHRGNGDAVHQIEGAQSRITLTNLGSKLKRRHTGYPSGVLGRRNIDA